MMVQNLRVEGQITFFYYRNLEAAEEFYGGVMGFDKVIDLSFAKVFRISSGAHVGLVGEGGYLNPADDKPVMLTVMVEDAEAWHRMLTEKRVRTNHPPEVGKGLDMKGFLTSDPEGYILEILQFNKKPYGF